MALKETVFTGPSISYKMYIGIPTDESCTDRTFVGTNEGGTITFTFQDDTTLDVEFQVGERYALSSDVKSVTSSVEVILN